MHGIPDPGTWPAQGQPERPDGKGLVDSFDVMVRGPTVKRLQADGYLAQAACYGRDGAVDALRSIRKLGGDFNRGDVALLMMELSCTEAAIVDYRKLGAGRPGFTFCCTVAHEVVAQAFAEAGIAAASVDGKMATDERDAILIAFAAGEPRKTLAKWYNMAANRHERPVP